MSREHKLHKQTCMDKHCPASPPPPVRKMAFAERGAEVGEGREREGGKMAKALSNATVNCSVRRVGGGKREAKKTLLNCSTQATWPIISWESTDSERENKGRRGGHGNEMNKKEETHTPTRFRRASCIFMGQCEEPKACFQPLISITRMYTWPYRGREQPNNAPVNQVNLFSHDVWIEERNVLKSKEKLKHVHHMILKIHTNCNVCVFLLKPLQHIMIFLKSTFKWIDFLLQV